MRRSALTGGAFLILAAAGAALALPAARFYWRVRADNPVRRGVRLARAMGCFSCHGELGAGGVPDPALGREVPGGSGGVWMMYVQDEGEAAEFIERGISARRAASRTAAESRARAAIRMPAYGAVLDRGEIEALTAAFLVISGMSRPQDDTPEAKGYDVAEKRRCFSCHGPGGSGGLPNPRSFTGFVPGWYGADFADLVRDRGEFDHWTREGSLPRLEANRAAAWFIERQRLKMPAYRDLPADELDALWAYVAWLGKTRGGLDAPTRSF